ncbi:hypothetical protein DENSPDRAFT_103783 [Dentipellis sp. KUC8613]|nr:hypothetical protein DENSPDRAFT_103783 [Dentipellis sp. KUC8613]
MLSLTLSLRQTAARRAGRCTPRSCARALSAAASSSGAGTHTPWFVDEEPAYPRRQVPPHMPLRRAEATTTLAPLPADVPPQIRTLHTALAQSPNLEPGALLVCEPLPTPPGPPLPEAMPKGRRRRGRTYVGEGVQEPGGIWNWIVIAQVKEGTEKRGAIESVMRLVRKTLSSAQPPLTLPLNSRRAINDGWAMLDAGDFAVHVVSGSARERFFSNRESW